MRIQDKKLICGVRDFWMSYTGQVWMKDRGCAGCRKIMGVTVAMRKSRVTMETAVRMEPWVRHMALYNNMQSNLCVLYTDKTNNLDLVKLSKLISKGYTQLISFTPVHGKKRHRKTRSPQYLRHSDSGHTVKNLKRTHPPRQTWINARAQPSSWWMLSSSTAH